MNYLDILEYLATHPIQSLFIVLAQFIVIMKIHHKVHSKYLHYALGAWFIPQDVIVNLILFSIIGFELPREWLVTDRLKRWKKLDTDTSLNRLRSTVGWKLCEVLNRFDMGHC